ncbi:MAG: sugar phosphate nucleotidyltransferase [Anaerolineae bacterium]|jgi:UTP-glucose-1-phosphate uridylyltransferase/mevalonate kinase
MELFVPGRICLFGEHSDWAGGYRRVNPEIKRGYTLICGTEQGIYAEVAPYPDALLLTATTPEDETLGPREIPMEPEALLDVARRGGFWSYIAGVAYEAMTHYQVGGLVIRNFKTDLPIQKGLSSSAAICVLAARAFNLLYDLKFTTRGEMELAYLGEITTPSRCGRMDQGCAFGSRPVLMTFDGDRLITEELRAGDDLHFVIVDLQAHKDTMKILANLNDCFPYASNQLQQGVQDLLGPVNEDIVHQAVEALQAGDGQRLGALMTKAQGWFDHYATPACPDELTAPVLHRVLEYGPLKPHIWGGKGVGSQGDGSAQFIARSEGDQQSIIEIVERELGMPCLKVTLRAGVKSEATTRVTAPIQVREPQAKEGDIPPVRKAVIPVAGLGTRLFPATWATKKEFFPIVDRNGIAKPAILLIIEEALGAGIEEVILIVQEQDLGNFQTLFDASTITRNHDRYPARLQGYAQRILEMGRRTSFAVQSVQEGFGHAVYCAREEVAGEPFLLMLGDHLYQTHSAKSCARQLLDAYEQHGLSVLGLRHVHERDVVHYGTVSGTWLDGNQLLELVEIAEKPTVDYARAHLHLPGLPEREYLAVFGQYILKPRLFDLLAENVASDRREGGEFELTTALDRLRQEEGFLGLVMDGQCYDIGLPESYLRTMQVFGSKRA